MKQITRVSKRFFVILLALLMASMPSGIFVQNSELGEVSVYFDGIKMEFDQLPVIVNSRTMVPFRAIFEAFGAEVEWSQEYQRVMAFHDVIGSVALYINSVEAFINWNLFELDAAPFVVPETSRTLVPIRFIAETFGADVQWDNDARNVIITPDWNFGRESWDWEEPTWEEIEDFGGGSAFIDPSEDGDFGNWHPDFRNQIVGNYYYNSVGWRMSVATYSEMIAERDRIVSQIIRSGMSEFEIIRAAHDWLVDNVSYNDDVWSWERQRATGNGWNPNFRPIRYDLEHQFAWSALVLRTTVCAGYSDAMIYLLEPFGIEALYIYGSVTFPGSGTFNHAWNLVHLGGQWYHIDSTWNRQYFRLQGHSTHHLVIYDWFLVSDSVVRTQGASSRNWNTANFPAAPNSLSWDRPQLIADWSIGRMRHRTPQDDMPFNINVSSNMQGAGTVTANPSSSQSGQWVTINAHANQGFGFERWEIVSGNISFHQTQGGWASFMMPTNDVTLRAVFTQTHQISNVTISVSDTQAGTATASPHSNVMQGNWVSLQARANTGFEFDRWEIVSGNPSILEPHFENTGFNMPSSNVSIRAVFRREGEAGSQTVTTSANNAAWGAVSASQSGNVQQGTTVWLTATPNSGYSFSHWELISGNTNIQNANSQWAEFVMPSGAVSVRAVFIETQIFTVTVSVNNNSWGIATASPNTGLLGDGRDWVNLIANPNTGFEFSHWEVISGSANLGHDRYSPSTSFAMPASNVSIRAVFREIQMFSVNVSVNDTRMGTGSAEPNTNLLGEGWEWVGLSANPNTGFEFSHWEVVSGGVALTYTNLIMSSFLMPANNVSIRAVFKETPSFSVNVILESGGWAVASPDSNLRGEGEWISVQAHADFGFTFSHWDILSGNISLTTGSNSSFNSFTMPSENVTLRAVFVPD